MLKTLNYNFLRSLIPQAIWETCTIFTYSSACLGKAALVSEGQSWVKTELGAIVYAFEMFPKKLLNIVSDLAYSLLVTKQIETSLICPNIPPKPSTIMPQL
jgi:hypothetical protein